MRHRNKQHRITVGRRLRCNFRGEVGIRSRPVVDDELLTQTFGQLGADDAGHDVSAAARGITHQKTDGFNRISLCSNLACTQNRTKRG